VAAAKMKANLGASLPGTLEKFPRELARLVPVLNCRRRHESVRSEIDHDSDEGRPDWRIPCALLASEQDRYERPKRQQEEYEVTES